LRKACGLDVIPNKCLRHLPSRPLAHLTHHCLWLSHFPKPGKEAKVTLLEPGKGPKFSQNLCLISLLSTTGKLLEKVILKIVQRHIEERGQPASQSGFHACQCTRFTDHITLHFDNSMATVAVFLDTEKAFDTAWHLGLLHKKSNLKFSVSLIMLTSYLLSQRKFTVSVKGKMSTQREIQAGVPHKVLSCPARCTAYILS
jgi:hypothetical protein